MNSLVIRAISLIEIDALEKTEVPLCKFTIIPSDGGLSSIPSVSQLSCPATETSKGSEEYTFRYKESNEYINSYCESKNINTDGSLQFTNITGKDDIKLTVSIRVLDKVTNEQRTLPGLGNIMITSNELSSQLHIGSPRRNQCELLEDGMPYGTLTFEYELERSGPKQSTSDTPPRLASPINKKIDDIDTNNNVSPSPSSNRRRVISSGGHSPVAVRPTTAKPSRVISKATPVSVSSNNSDKVDNKLGSRSRSGPPPVWSKQTVPTNFRWLAEDLALLDFQNIKLRLHSTVLTIKKGDVSDINKQSATALISLGPMPNKQTILRSKVGHKKSSIKNNKIEWSFEKKTAVLSLSNSDLRSRLYREGLCPKVQIQMNMGGMAFQSSLYLPALLERMRIANAAGSSAGSNCSGMMCVPMLQSDYDDVNTQPATGTLVIEVTTKNGKETYLSDSVSGNQEALTQMIDECHLSGATKVKSKVTFQLNGIKNFSYSEQQYPYFRIMCRMSASATYHEYDFRTALMSGVVTWKQGNTKGFTINDLPPIVLDTTWPEADIIEISLYTGVLPEDEIGCVCIPLATLLASDDHSLLEETLYNSALNDTNTTNGNGTGTGLRTTKGSWVLNASHMKITGFKANKSATASTTATCEESSSVQSHTHRRVHREHTSSSSHGAESKVNVSGSVVSNNWIGEEDGEGNDVVGPLPSVSGGMDAMGSRVMPGMPGMNNSYVQSQVSMFSVAPGATNKQRAPVCSGVVVGCVYGFVAKTEYISGVDKVKPSQFSMEFNLEPTSRKSSNKKIISVGEKSDMGHVINMSSYSFIETSNDRKFKFPMTWSSQQKKAPFLRVGVFYNTGNSSNGIWNASATIDMASITYKSRSLVVGFVPVLESLSSSEKDKDRTTGKTASTNEIIGWVLISLNFSHNDKCEGDELNRKNELEKLENVCRSLWSSVTSPVEFPLTRLDVLLGNSQLKSSATATAATVGGMSESLAMSLHPNRKINKIGISNSNSISNGNGNNSNFIREGSLDLILQTVIAPLELSTTVIEKVRSMMSGEGQISLILSLGTDSTQAIDAISINNNQLLFGENSVMLNLRTEKLVPLTSMFSTLYINLTYSSTSDALPRTIAESAILIPAETIHLGLPLDVCIPLRDRGGDRFALMDMNAHMTSFGRIGAGAGTNLGGISNNININNNTIMQGVSEEVPETDIETGIVSSDDILGDVDRDIIGTGNGATASISQTREVSDEEKIYINVSFEEGSVGDSSWWAPIEPFFECNLVAPDDIADSTATRSSRLQDRTPFLPQAEVSQHEVKKWGLSCKLSIPANCVPKAEDKEKSGSVKWILAIVVRDSARLGCPEVGYARVGIPWTVLQHPGSAATASSSGGNGGAILTSLEQWIDISPPKGSKNHGEAAGRVFIHVNTYDAKVYRNVENDKVLSCISKRAHMTGIGVCSFWLKKMFEIAAGTEEISMTMIGAQISSHVLTLNHSPADNDDEVAEPFADISVIHNGSNGPESMCGTIPVPGGNAEIRLKVHSSNSKVQYCTSYPVLASTPKIGDDDNEASDVAAGITSLDLLITDSFNNNQTHTARQLKRAPKLKIDTAFIPFVQGTLMITIHSVKFRGNIEGKFLAKDARSGCFRSVLSPDSFGYSESFDLNVPQAKDELIIARMALPVDTLQLAEGSNSCATVELSLIDLDAKDDGGKGYVLGSGSVRTASLYYQAVRAAASSCLPTKNAQGIANGTVGASPPLPSQVDIVDKTLNRTFATVLCSVQFVATSIPPKVLHGIQSVGDNSSNSNSNSNKTAATDIVIDDFGRKSQIELSLKDAFLAADTDKSGSVSSQELLSVIKRSKDNQRDGDIFTSMLMSLAGFKFSVDNDTGDMAGMGASMNAQQPTIQDLEKAVSTTFNRLDVDGDGSISWWEWRRVLIASLLENQQANDFVNLKDSLLLGLLAANDAILAANSSPHSLSNGSSVVVPMDMTVAGVASGTASYVNVPFVKVDQTNTRASQDGGAPSLRNTVRSNTGSNDKTDGVRDPLDDLPDDILPAKAVPRLQNMVKSLRYQNSALTQRLEQAIVHSHRILSRESNPKEFVESFKATNGFNDADADANNGNATNQSISMSSQSPSKSLGVGSASGIDYTLEVSKATRRAHDAEFQQQIMAKALQMEKKRSQDLEMQLSQARRIADGLNAAHRENKMGSESTRKQIQMEIERHNQAIEERTIIKKKKMQATALLVLFFHFKVLPKVRARIKQRKEDKLKLALSGIVKHRKIRRDTERRVKAISTLQARARGFGERKAIKQKSKGATDIQKIFRGKKARDLRRRMLLEKTAACFSEQYRAQSILRRCVTKWLLRRREAKDAAALKIQNIAKKRKLRAEGKKSIEQLRKEVEEKKEKYILHHNSSTVIQKHLRGRHARKHVASKKTVAQLEKEENQKRIMEMEKQVAESAAKTKERNDYITKRSNDIRKYLKERDIVTTARKPALNDSKGFWVLISSSKVSLNTEMSYSRSEIEEAEKRYVDLISMVMQIHSLKERERNSNMKQDKDEYHRTKVSVQLKFIDSLEEYEEINITDLSDAYSYLADLQMNERKYNDALISFDQSYSLVELHPEYAASAMKKVAYVAYLQAQMTGKWDEAIKRCQTLLIETEKIYGTNSTEYALAQVFAANIYQVANTYVNSNSNSNGEDEVTCPKDSDILTLLSNACIILKDNSFISTEIGLAHTEASNDLKAIKILMQINEHEEQDKKNRSRLLPQLSHVHSYDASLRVLNCNHTSHTLKTLDILLNIKSTVNLKDFEDIQKTFPYDHPQLRWFATKNHAEKYKSSSGVNAGNSKPKHKTHTLADKTFDAAFGDYDQRSRSNSFQTPQTPSYSRSNSMKDVTQSITSPSPHIYNEKEVGNHSVSYENKTLVSKTNAILEEAKVKAIAAEKVRQDIIDEAAASGQGGAEYEYDECDQRPSLTECTEGYLITYSADGTEDERMGHVYGSDIGKRLIVVAFSDQQQNPISPRLEFISYDHPNLYWYKDTAFMDKIIFEKKKNIVSVIQQFPRPKSIHDSIGSLVEVPSTEPDADEGDMHAGKIVFINANTNIVSVAFQKEGKDDEWDETDVDNYEFDSPMIAWMEQPILNVQYSKNVPMNMQDALGFSVEVKSKELNAHHTDMYQGRVVYVDEKRRKIEIAFALDGDEDGSDYEEYDYDSPHVAWVDPPNDRLHAILLAKSLARNEKAAKEQFLKAKSSAPTTPVVSPKKQTPKFIAHIHSRIERPLVIDEAVGYRVELQSSEPGADIGDMFPGKVVNVNISTKQLKIRFDVENGYDSDYELVDWDSEKLAWMLEPPKGQVSAGSSSPDKNFTLPSPTTDLTFKHRHSNVERPEIQNAVGYLVEVQSHDPGALDGDMFPGKVVSVDSYAGTLRIMFDVEEGFDPDFEEVRYLSRDIAWMDVPKILDLNASGSRERLKKSMNTNTSSSSVQKLEYINHKHSAISRPPLADVVGYGVEVQSHEEGALEGDMFPGQVVSYQKDTGIIKVKFVVEDGCDSDYDDVHYDSHDIAWMYTPAPDPTPRPEEPEPEPVVKLTPKYTVDDRVEGNYRISGQWYKGDITAVREDSDGLPVYDITYDDDETEEDIAEVNVRKIEKKPLAERMARYNSPPPKKEPVVKKEPVSKVEPEPEPVVESVAASVPEPSSAPSTPDTIKTLFVHILSKVVKPSLVDAVGYSVEIQSHEEGAQEGDMFPGKVVDVIGNQLRIEFEVEEGQEADFEDIDFDSHDIAWMSSPESKVSVAATATTPLIDENKMNQQADADDEELMGNVPVDEPEGEDDDESLMNQIPERGDNQVPRPKLKDAVGYLVEVQSHEEGAEEGDMFAGRVVLIDLLTKRLTVAFEVEDGQDEDIEDLDYDSQDICWMALPAPVPEPK
jgi:Ca2+-binding EF-hand superfamily protein